MILQQIKSFIIMQKTSQLELYFDKVITKLHQKLANHFTYAEQQREITTQQYQLLSRQYPNSQMYKQITTIIAIQSYIEYVITLIAKCQPLLEITALLFNNLAQIQQRVESLKIEDLNQQLIFGFSTLSKSAQIIHQLFPNSPLVTVNQQFMNGAGSDPTQAIYARLYDENQQLKSKLEQNDKQLLGIELSLTKMIKQHDQEQSIDNSLKILQLRQMISIKEGEMAKMNEQFGIEITKYNVVYEAMKKQIQELRSYENLNQYDVIGELQTEIIRLREQKERDQQIIRELNQTIQFANSSRYQSKITYSRMQY